eukprot:scaffold655464_cov65-Prasinocladus_malaysianus.AAC.1
MCSAIATRTRTDDGRSILEPAAGRCGVMIFSIVRSLLKIAKTDLTVLITVDRSKKKRLRRRTN